MEIVVTSIYGLVSEALHKRMLGELAEIAASFQGLPLLFGEDFIVTLKMEDRPHEAGGIAPGSEEFLKFLLEA